MSYPNRLNNSDETRRLLIMMLVMSVGFLAWNYVYEYPRQQAIQKREMQEAVKQKQQEKLLDVTLAEETERARQKAVAQPKIDIKTPEVQGSVSLQGARLNRLMLLNYKQEAKKDSPPVELLMPEFAPEAYFMEFGWVSEDKNIILPTRKTVWQTQDTALTPHQPITLFWENGQGLRFELRFTQKDAYLFSVEQKVINNSERPVTLLPYGYINRSIATNHESNMVSHEGAVGVVDGTSLTEIGYKDLLEEKKRSHKQAAGWVGISDKYWLTALIPSQKDRFTAKFKGYKGNETTHRYQVDFLAQPQTIAAGASNHYESMVFAGAKKLRMLDNYAEKYQIPLFDRAVDLGFLYFLTKPLLALLHWLYVLIGDFGLAILMLTVIVKIGMYPLADKSYASMNEMKKLQPKLQKIKERCKDDKLKFQQEMMQLYKQEKINPASGCLPIIIQMPVFFALYKVLYVTIEMRHAPFLNLIHDLSAQDPTNVFTLFGVLDWVPPSFLHLGIMPILFALSMAAQQSMSPKPADAAQAKMMEFLPWIFMVIMATFPAGMLLYWIWSNLLSILQQWSIKFRYNKREIKKLAKAANDI
jgi:YidC/Oxa1 family membrane protein insertase